MASHRAVRSRCDLCLLAPTYLAMKCLVALGPHHVGGARGRAGYLKAVDRRRPLMAASSLAAV